MSKIKVLLVHNRYQLPGGEDLGFDSEVRMLRENGHEVIEYVRKNNDIKNYSFPQKILFPKEMTWSQRTYEEISKILIDKKPDIAHFHNTFPLISPSAYYACQKFNIPVVQLLNNYRLICPGGFLFRDDKVCEDCISKSLMESVKNRCYKNSYLLSSSLAMMIKFHRIKNTWFSHVNKYISLSEFSKNKYVEAGFKANQIFVKSNFIEKDPLKRNKYDNHVLFFGRLSREKGPHIFIKAAENLINTKIKFRIIGNGPMDKELNNYVLKKKITNVEFVNHISNSDIFNQIKSAKFVVIPMMWYEFLPRVLIETLACGVPIITSDIGVMANIVRNQINGLHFKVGDHKDLSKKIIKLFNDDLLVDKISKNNRDLYLSEYTKEKNYQKLINIYNEVLDEI